MRTKLEFESNIFKSSNKFIFYEFFYKFVYNLFSRNIKMSKNFSTKYYQENKRLQKKPRERYQNLSKE